MKDSKDLSPQERCDEAYLELASLLDKYEVDLGVDLDGDEPVFYVCAREEADMPRLH